MVLTSSSAEANQKLLFLLLEKSKIEVDYAAIAQEFDCTPSAIQQYIGKLKRNMKSGAKDGNGCEGSAVAAAPSAGAKGGSNAKATTATNKTGKSAKTAAAAGKAGCNDDHDGSNDDETPRKRRRVNKPTTTARAPRATPSKKATANGQQPQVVENGVSGTVAERTPAESDDGDTIVVKKEVKEEELDRRSLVLYFRFAFTDMPKA